MNLNEVVGARDKYEVTFRPESAGTEERVEGNTFTFQ